MMSSSPKRDEFQQYLETTIQQDLAIDTLTIRKYFSLVGAKEEFLDFLYKKHKTFLDFTLPLTSSIK